jgi:hypothetical protein
MPITELTKKKWRGDVKGENTEKDRIRKAKAYQAKKALKDALKKVKDV